MPFITRREDRGFREEAEDPGPRKRRASSREARRCGNREEAALAVETRKGEETIGRERASESIVVADPAGTLTPCSQSPPSPLPLYIFPGSCRVAVPSITRSYLTFPARHVSPRLVSPRFISPRVARRVCPDVRVSRREIPEESPVFSPPFLDAPYTFFPATFPMSVLLSVLPPPPIAVTRNARADFAHSFFSSIRIASFSSVEETEQSHRKMQNVIVNFDILATRRRC